MRTLSANLKHLYQKRSFWFVGLFYAVFAFGVIMVITEGVAENKRGCFSAPVLWMFFASLFIASLSIEVLTKPFSFCLPGHKKIPRKFLFVIGLGLSFLWSLSFLFYLGLNLINAIAACTSALSAFTVFYWLGVWFVFRFRNWSVVFALIPLLMIGNQLLSLGSITERIIVESFLPMILLGGLVNFLAWSYLGKPNLARRYC